MRTRGLNLILLLLLAIAAPAHAANTHVNYVGPDDLPPQLLPPPPALKSTEWRKNDNLVLAAQKHISADDKTALLDEQHLRVEHMTDFLGADFTRQRYPKTYVLLDRVFADTENITRADKEFWHTKRPYLADTRVKLLVEHLDQSPSYPSGHTSGSRVLAEVLGMLYPAYLADFRAKADAIAQHRVEAGVHYPCDIDAGRSLAMLITGALLKSAEFQSDLADARAEIKSR